MVNKNEEKGGVWAHLAICLHPTSPSPPPLHPEPAAKSGRRKRKEREKETTAEPGGLAGATAPPKAEKKFEPPSFLQYITNN